MELSKVQNNYIERHEARKNAVIDCLKKHKAGISQADISAEIGINRKYVSGVLKKLKETNKIHIHSWMATGGVTYALWVYGRGFDADKRIVQGKKHPSEKKMLERKRLEDVGSIRDIVMRKHAQWQKTWKPHADIAAAWMMRG